MTVSSSPFLTAGQLVIAGDARYDDARRAWNLTVDQRPAAVALPESAADVSTAVRYAAARGLRVAAQGTGHGSTTLGPRDAALLIKNERMRKVIVDPAARIARVEAGVLWRDVVTATAGYGLAPLAGSSPDVGVVGYTLGGGLSCLGRKHGLACNAVTAVELVTANGALVRADTEHETELFWALRGGGGSFGVVTALEFTLVPLASAYAGVLWYPMERAAEVLHAWAGLTRGPVPDELTTVARLLNIPPLPDIPEPLRGKSFVAVEAVHIGDPRAADAQLAALRGLGPVNDTMAVIPATALIGLHMDPEQPVPGTGDGMLIDQLPAAAVDALVSVAGSEAAFPLVAVDVHHLGGELARSRPRGGALASLDAGYALMAAGMTPVPELVPPVTAQVAAVRAALAPWAARRRFCNYADTPDDPASFWGEDASRRLAKIKTAVDPGDLFMSNHPVLGGR